VGSDVELQWEVTCNVRVLHSDLRRSTDRRL